MIEVEVENGQILLGNTSEGEFTYNVDEFQKALRKSFNNDKEYYYQDRACKQYRIGDSEYTVGIVPIREENRLHNIENLNEVTHDYIMLQISNVHTPERYFRFPNESFRCIISKLDNFKVREMFTGELVDYPERWQRRNGCIILNEAFEIDIEVMKKGIVYLVEKSKEVEYEEYKFEAYGGKEYVIKYKEDSIISCDSCGKDHTELVHLKNKIDSASILPRSAICFECLPEFTQKYFNFKQNDVLTTIVSNKI